MASDYIDIEIKNCKNISSGSIKIEKNKLNIKFGINGTGKSTTADAIRYKIENNEQELNNFLPFNLRGENPGSLKPEVIMSEKITSVSVFNEEYIRNTLFTADDLISNSFEVFIKTPQYIANEKIIEKQLEDIKKVFSENTELEQIILDFESLSKSFKTTKDGLSEASAISKGLRDGNKLNNIPEDLKDYKSYIQDKEKCVSWLDWQMKGNNFSDGHENCPYCISPTNEEQKQKIKSVSTNYDKNVIKNFIEIIKVLENLGDYFLPEAKNKLEEITRKTDGLLDEEKNYITNIKGQIESFLQRLKKLREISFHNLKDEKIKEKIESFIIKIDDVFDKLKSDKTIKIIDTFNASLDKTLKEIIELQKHIGIQKTEIRNSIDKNQKSINQFLKNAGYKYQVSIQDENSQHKIKLQHVDFKENISGGNQHLSFGEKNAFALVLFMYVALSKKSDLIILDDPISSFDKNKKYAILQKLFREDISFKGKSVLMLTHDIEPIIDSIKSLSKKFESQTNADFIECRTGVLTEKKIEKKDILSFSQICTIILEDEEINIISKLIYLRRNFEILDDKGDEYQLLSDLFHKRTKDEAKVYRKVTDEYFESSFIKGEEKIGKFIKHFNYQDILQIVLDKNSLITIYDELDNGYEKLQLFRIINGDFTKGDDFSHVMKKFINETYHIENDFIHQLNPKKYNIIPEFIIEECDSYIESLKNEKYV